MELEGFMIWKLFFCVCENRVPPKLIDDHFAPKILISSIAYGIVKAIWFDYPLNIPCSWSWCPEDFCARRIVDKEEGEEKKALRARSGWCWMSINKFCFGMLWGDLGPKPKVVNPIRRDVVSKIIQLPMVKLAIFFSIVLTSPSVGDQQNLHFTFQA